MIEASLIQGAVATLDAKDDTVWEADGTPKLDVLKLLTSEPTLSLDDIDEAIGAFKRGDKAKWAAAKPKTSATEAKPTEEVVVDVTKLDPNSPEYAEAMVKQARTVDIDLKKQLTEAELAREKLNVVIRELTAKRDVQIVIIERYSPKISHAEAVKAIQRQTQATLKATKDRMAIATQMLGPTGTPLVFPSKLDAAMSSRKRSPEQVKNYASFVHQQAAGDRPPV